MNSIRILIATLLLVSLGACAPDPDDPESMAREQAPEHNPEATYKGRTALQYAERLDDLSWVQQQNALRSLEAMRVDALPAREAVRDLIDEIASRDLEPSVADDLEVNAVAVLAAMQAPEAPAMVRQRIADPDFSARTGPYERLILGATQMGIEADTLTADVVPLAASEPDHALRLLQTGRLPDQTREALGQALFETDHDSQAVQFFLENLSDFAFVNATMDDAEVLGYVREHKTAAREASRETQDLLADIGTAPALELALEISDTSVVENPRLVSQFAHSDMGPEPAMALMLEAVMAADTPREINTGINAMARIPRDLVNSAREEETRVLPADAVHEMHLRTLGRLVSDGPSADHRTAAIQELTRYVQRNKDVPFTPSLDPVFEIARDSAAAPETRLTAQRSLQRVQPGRDPAYFYSETVSLLWAGTDARSTEIPQSMLVQTRREPEHAALVIDHLSESVDDHEDAWAVNPAGAVALNLAAIRQFDGSDTREQGAILAGHLIADPQAELRFLEPHLRQHAGALVNFDNNTVPRMIGLLGPTIFAEHQAVHRQFEPEAFASVMLGQPAWFADQPEAVTEWEQFLQKVVSADRAHFSPAAQTALDDL